MKDSVSPQVSKKHFGGNTKKNNANIPEPSDIVSPTLSCLAKRAYLAYIFSHLIHSTPPKSSEKGHKRLYSLG